MARFILLSALVCLISGCAGSSRSMVPTVQASPSVTAPTAKPAPAFTLTGTPAIVVDAPAAGFPYAYAPSIVFTQGVWHAYFCSTGTGATAWDVIREVTSTDMVTWSAPDTVLTPSNYERSTCDPSVVLGTDGFYYLFYGGNVVADQTVIFEARSTSPDGPFLKLTVRNTWELSPSDSKIIVAPVNPSTSGSVYGAGQPTVVIRNGVWYLWYSDDTASTTGDWQQYMISSFDGFTWTQATPTNAGNTGTNSVDVKIDPSTGLFTMLSMNGQFTAESALVTQTSSDGIHWQAAVSLGNVPAGSNNPGWSSDDQGVLIAGSTMVAFGAPYPGAVETTGQWSLWSQMLTQ